MSTHDPVTPRAARHRAHSVGLTANGMVGVKDLTDHAEPDQINRYHKIVDALLEEATGGKVKRVRSIIVANEHSVHILSLNSFDYETKIRDAVAALKFPWTVERSDDRGLRENPNSLEGRFETGFPTLMIVRRALYRPQTHSCVIGLAGFLIVFVFVFASSLLYWMFALVSGQ
jgi:hypothetical protein